MIIDLTKNINQQNFFNTSIAAIYGKNDYRILCYGGAIRGGKTIAGAAIFLTAAKFFHNSRWHIFRSDFPALQGTTIPSFEKIVGGNSAWGWNRDKSNYFLYHRKSDGKIFFKGENISQDPELDNLLGMETNGMWLEQSEELSLKLWEMADSRNGSWYIDPMPVPIKLTTFNPTQNWIKELIYEPWAQGELKAPYYYQLALPSDNPFVTKEQWDAWGRMADRYQKQFIESDWTDFANKDNLWAFAFSAKKIVVPGNLFPAPTRKHELHLTFDFNKNPICCTVLQDFEGQTKVYETIKLANSDIYALCDYILAHYPNYLYMVTGDATGQNSSALVQDNKNFYTVIKQKLNLTAGQIRVPKVNPTITENQVLVNSYFANGNIIMHKEKAKALIYDCQNVRISPDKKIDKTNRLDPTKQADALDTLRYWINVYKWDFIKHL